MQQNDKAPDFNLTLVDGKTKSFYSIAEGKTAVLFFYPSSAKYSKTCQKQSAAFNGSLAELGDNVQVIGVSVGNLGELKTFKEKFASNFPVGLIDRKTLKAYDARKGWIFSNFAPDIIASKRVTFIITADHIIAERIDLPGIANGPAMTAHAKEVVEKVKELNNKENKEARLNVASISGTANVPEVALKWSKQISHDKAVSPKILAG
jgi:alkyl hydroperoxide reductase subunit AhpC